MERYRRKKLIIIIALILTISGLSIGFAAFTSVLTISSTATVRPDESSFSVLFSSSGTSQVTAQIIPTVSGATGDKATISGTTISGLKANFTEPGQSVIYTFWAHNAGSYIAYLRNITYGTATGESSFKYCTPGTNTTADLVTAACEDISVSVSVGSTSVTATTNTPNHPLSIDGYEQVVVTITYASDGDRADGSFDVSFGDITLNYSSVDASEITIAFHTGERYTAIEGMTWLDFINSEYNVDNFYIKKNNVYIDSENYLAIGLDSNGDNKIDAGTKWETVYPTDLIRSYDSGYFYREFLD